VAVIVADTDVLIDFLSGHEPAASRVASEIAEEAGLVTTVVSRFELLAGARRPKQERAVRQLLEALAILDLDSRGADRAAQVRRDLDKAGAPIGMADSLIAGIVLRYGGRLLTRNHRHFERVEGLALAPLTQP
jgi:predicted nucleic acid-binding protein